LFNTEEFRKALASKLKIFVRLKLFFWNYDREEAEAHSFDKLDLKKTEKLLTFKQFLRSLVKFGFLLLNAYNITILNPIAHRLHKKRHTK